MDLNIKIKGSSNERDLLPLYKRLLELGFDTLAWNQTILGSTINRCQAKPVKHVNLSPYEASVVRKLRELAKLSFIDTEKNKKNIKNMKKNIKNNEQNINNEMNPIINLFVNYNNTLKNEILQLNRLTIHIDKEIEVQSLTTNNKILQSFDLLAVVPHNFKSFESLCKEGEIDIISFDLLNKLEFSLNQKIIKYAQVRGIFFEINLNFIFSNDPKRSNIFSNTSHLIQILRGKNLIFSSAAEFSNQLRGPFEYLNVAKMLGLTQEQAFNAIFNSLNDVLDHATARKNNYLPVEKISFEDFLKAEEEIDKKLNKNIKKYKKNPYSDDECVIDDEENKKKKFKQNENELDENNEDDEEKKQEIDQEEEEEEEEEEEDDGFIKF